MSAQNMPWRPKSLPTFRRKLLAWFRVNRIAHPWRLNRDPYRIWLAEVMLQQTRIAAVIPYYEKFLARFPDIAALANTPEDDVLRHWAGLGYYSRARNLQKAAREILAKHAGKFPADFEAVLMLPGVGPYIAAAVASIVFDAPHAVLDGNVARVLARLGAIRGDLREPRIWSQLSATAQDLLAAKSPGDWNQALMELGETICTPKSPQCAICPLAQWCEARRRNLVNEIPAPRKKRSSVRQKIAAAVLLDTRGRTLLVRDPGAHDDVLFSRMWQFPAIEAAQNAKSELARHLTERYSLTPAQAAALAPLPHAKHGVTFRNITLMPFLARVAKLPQIPRSRRPRLRDIARLPVSSATRKIAAAALQALEAGWQPTLFES
jgi:A/G-specific adenine glycosylase